MNGYLDKIAMLISVITNYLLVKFLSEIHFQNRYLKDIMYHFNETYYILLQSLRYFYIRFYTLQRLMCSFEVQDKRIQGKPFRRNYTKRLAPVI